jgi:3-methyladenine DNA glycosylase AlkD
VSTTPQRVREILRWIERRGSKRNVEGMARYAIVANKVYGVSMTALKQLAKRLGRDHALAAALWDTGVYEARMLTAFVDDPALVTPAQMDRWARDFDNWAICDGVCFHLFDRTPYAWRKVSAWSARRGEFQRRAAFALVAAMAVHDKKAGDAPFMKALQLIEKAAGDERNFVKKGVSWALRTTGRRNRELNAKAVAVARRLVESPHPAARWVGRDALRELTTRPFPPRTPPRAPRAARALARSASARPPARTRRAPPRSVRAGQGSRRGPRAGGGIP